jgi:hypothetical protein
MITLCLPARVILQNKSMNTEEIIVLKCTQKVVT